MGDTRRVPARSVCSRVGQSGASAAGAAWSHTLQIRGEKVSDRDTAAQGSGTQNRKPTSWTADLIRPGPSEPQHRKSMQNAGCLAHKPGDARLVFCRSRPPSSACRLLKPHALFWRREPQQAAAVRIERCSRAPTASQLGGQDASIRGSAPSSPVHSVPTQYSTGGEVPHMKSMTVRPRKHSSGKGHSEDHGMYLHWGLPSGRGVSSTKLRSQKRGNRRSLASRPVVHSVASITWQPCARVSESDNQCGSPCDFEGAAFLALML